MREKPIAEGTVVGYLTVLHKGQRDKQNRITYMCKCKCGNSVDIRADYLRLQSAKSCGCIHEKYDYNKSGHHTKHGMSSSPEYNTWCNMKSRCNNPKNPCWKSYGGRGITVDPEWIGKNGFEQFLKDVGRKPDKSYSLDRVNNSLGYNPKNVEWRDAYSQVHNRRSVSRIESLSDSQIAAELAKRGLL